MDPGVVSEHTPTFTTYQGTHGVYCTCGFTRGGGNELAAARWFDAHLGAETMGISEREAFELGISIDAAERSYKVEQILGGDEAE